MNKFFKRSVLLTAFAGLLIFNSCKDDPALPENLTEFESDQLGLSSAETELIVNLKLVREADTEGTVTIQTELTGLTYGTDFTTEPATAANTFTINVPVGATSASFKLKKVSGALFDGDEKIKFTIQSIAPSLVIGEKKELTLTFAELLASTGSLEINGGGALYPNTVYLDLSANRQTAIARTTWDLAFSSSDDFRVILNSPNGMMARALTKTDLNTVTAADTVGFGARLSLTAVFGAVTGTTIPDWVALANSWTDDPAGDLTKTAIASVSATVSENKVYIINRGTGPGSPTPPSLGWKKVRIIRNGSNYTLQHADINATTFTEVQITKNVNNRFQYVSFASGVVSVEPAKKKWDIAWTGFTNTTAASATLTFPYYFQDFVLQNTNGVQTVQVLTSTIGYDAFSETNLTGLTFSSSQINIGSAWRSGGGPTTAPSIRTDRFYVIKDTDGNYYKLKFTALTTNGERGKPQVQFALVKKAA